MNAWWVGLVLGGVLPILLIVVVSLYLFFSTPKDMW